jgi:DNA-binding NtrC family response regulator
VERHVREKVHVPVGQGEVLGQTQFDKREAARLLGISLASLYRKLNADSDDDPEPEEA